MGLAASSSGVSHTRAHDAVVQRAIGVETDYIAQIGKAQIGDVAPRVVRGVAAEQGGGFDVMRGFFQRFAAHGFDQRFAAFPVTGRLVEAQAFGGFLFHQQKFAVALDDGGDDDVG